MLDLNFVRDCSCFVVGYVVVLHMVNLVPFRPGLERVEKFLGKRDGRVPEEEVGGGSERQN